MKALLIACSFNEGMKLEKTVERIARPLKSRQKQPTVDVLIVDDGSTDSAPDKAAEKFGFYFLKNSVNKGIGYSIRKAYEFGLQNKYDILMTIAGNNKDNPDEMDRLMDPIVSGQADFVQGSRYLPGGAFGNMPYYRFLATRYVHPSLFSLIAGQRITDSTNGFRAVRASVLKDPRMDLNQKWLENYELEPYLFCQAIRLGYRVIEVPVSKVYPDEKSGYSKMKPITGWWSILKPLFYLPLRIKK